MKIKGYFNQRGAGHLLLIFAVIGVLSYLLISNTFDFKNKILNALFPKPASQAEEYLKDAEKYGYIIELKDEPVIEKKKKAEEKGDKFSKEDYKNQLKSKKEEAKKDIKGKIGKSQKKSGNVLSEFENTFNGFAMDIDASQAEEVKKSPYVKNVYPNLEVKAQLNDSVPMIGADKVWAQIKDSQGRPVTGEGVKIAVLDTGIDTTHPDLGSSQFQDRNFVKVNQQQILQIPADNMFSIDNNRLIYPTNQEKVFLPSGGFTFYNKLAVYDFNNKTTQLFSPFEDNKIWVIDNLTMHDNWVVYLADIPRVPLDTPLPYNGIYLYDLNTNTNKFIAESRTLSSPTISNGKIIFGGEDSSSPGYENLYIYDIQTGVTKIIDGPFLGLGGAPRARVSGDMVAYMTSNSCDSTQLWLYNIKTDQKTQVSPKPDYLGGVLDFKGSKILYFHCFEGTMSTYHLYDVNTKETTKLAFSPDSIINSNTDPSITAAVFSNFGPKGSLQDGVIFLAFNAGKGVYAYDLKQNRYVQITLYQTMLSSMDATGNKVCFLSAQYEILCHDYDSNYNYPPPDYTKLYNDKVISGINFTFGNNSPNTLDDNGHGTHVGATVAGNGVLKGVAPDAKLVSYKVLTSFGSGFFSWIISAIDTAAQTRLDSDLNNDIDVISMSIGANCGTYSLYCGPDDPLSKALDNAVETGITTVIAAGNSGPNSSTITSPGTSRKSITVGAVDKSKMIASFSSRGPIAWNGENINKPDVVAPGVSICAAEWKSYKSSNRCIDDKHVAISGTSMATPHVAGLAALIQQYNPGWTPQQVKDAIKKNAVNLNLDMNTQGAGLIDAFAIFPKPLLASCSASGTTFGINEQVTFTAQPSDGHPPYQYTWSGTDGLTGVSQNATKSYSSPGTKSATVTVTDSSSQTKQASCSVTVIDNVAPAVSVTFPTSNSTVMRKFDVKANATDNVAVSSVQFKIDGVKAGIDQAAPYSFSWDTRTVSNGTHTITAVATDSSGNITTSSTVTVNVDNSYNRVFVTKSSFSGNLGGLSGADFKCQGVSSNLIFGGTFKAWLSDSLTPASSRISHSTLPYKLLNGTTIASNWTDLTSNKLLAPINIDETGQVLQAKSTDETGAIISARYVWTNSTKSGGIDSTSNNCKNYTSASSLDNGKVGRSDSIDGNWSSSSKQSCDKQASLYCFEQ